MLKDFIDQLVADLRERAADREREGANTAFTYRRVADELAGKFEAYLDEELDMSTAMHESGYSAESLRLFLRDGQIAKLRRRDLPRKPGHGIDRDARPSATGTLDRAMAVVR